LIFPRPSAVYLRIISSAVLAQALLSAGNFLVGLMLIRRTPPDQYGYYVLIVTAVLLLTSLQGAFIQPSMVKCLASAEIDERRDFIGGVYREQQRFLFFLASACALLLAVLWFFGVVGGSLALIVLAGITATMAAIYREFFRMVLFSYRLPMEALKVDTCYVILLLGGAFLATRTATPAVAAALALTVAAAAGGWLFARVLRRREGWNPHSAPGIIKSLAPMGTWALIGAAIHWTFSQGYVYLVAGTLDVTAVATLAATRLLMMPVNLMSSGIGSMTFPIVTNWLQYHPVRSVFHRLCMVAGAIACLAIVYFAVMWFLRDWIFAHVIKGVFPQRDTLLLLWSAVFLFMAVRDQMLYLPAAKGHFRIMAGLTLATAVLSLVISYVGMRFFGVVGALIGILAGEAFNILGFVALSLIEVRRAEAAVPAAGAEAQ
jgi:O-antigen/teichoic acid export membrane protein